MKQQPMSQTKPGRNTNNALPLTPKYQLYRWAFTLKSMVEPNEPNSVAKYNIEAEQLYDILKPVCKEFYYQLEKGENGFIHYQGCISLKNKEYMPTVKNMMGRNDVHLEGVRCWSASKNYCGKAETKVLGPWSHSTVWIQTITDLYPWQEHVVDMIKEDCSNDRKIHWFYDNEGCKGKSALSKYLYVRYNATVVNNGAFSDLAYSLPDNPKIVVFNLPRSLEKKVNYSAIEAIKDGMIFSGKYESKTKVFNSPHVLIMANFMPNLEALSKDRWMIHNLGEEMTHEEFIAYELHNNIYKEMYGEELGG